MFSYFWCQTYHRCARFRKQAQIRKNSNRIRGSRAYRGRLTPKEMQSPGYGFWPNPDPHPCKIVGWIYVIPFRNVILNVRSDYNSIKFEQNWDRHIFINITKVLKPLLLMIQAIKNTVWREIVSELWTSRFTEKPCS